MGYTPREELKSEPISERTSMLMRSVREILAEQGKEDMLDAKNFKSAEDAPDAPARPMTRAMREEEAAKKSGVQRPPHMQQVLNPALTRPPKSPATTPPKTMKTAGAHVTQAPTSAPAPAQATTARRAAPAVAPPAPAPAAPKARSFLARLIGR